MGCFLGCFGFKKKKKRRKPGKKSPSGQQNHGSYVPLDSDVSIKLDNKDQDITSSDSYQLKENPKEPPKSKIKKKVRFNLNVKAYEPIPNDDQMDIMYLSDGEEETKWEFNIETKSMSASLNYGDDSIASSSITSSYRYQNCRDSYDDEEEELKLDENDLNFDEIEDKDEEVDGLSSDESNDEILEGKNMRLEHLFNLQNKELQGFRSKFQSREMGQFVFPVLNRVENLNPWEVVKAKESTMQLKFEKENLIVPMQEVENYSSGKPNVDSFVFKKMRNSPNVAHPQGDNFSVDASLANWLGSLETRNGTKI